MSILVTGASGFIGCFLQQQLKQDAMYVVRKNSIHTLDNVFEVETIGPSTNWNAAFSGIDCIIHLAGLAHSKFHTKYDYKATNEEGTLKLARDAASKGVKRFVFISSIGVNGLFNCDSSVFSEKSLPKPHNIYTQSKFNAESGLINISNETGMEIVIVRPTLVYGPEAPGNFGLLTKLVHKFPLLPFGLANNKRDFIAVQNLVDLLIVCAKHPDAAGHTFLASDCETVSIKEFTNAIAKGLNRTVIQVPVPNYIMRFAAKLVGKSLMLEQLLGNLQVDSSNAKEVLGWIPPYTMEQAMASLSENTK